MQMLFATLIVLFIVPANIFNVLKFNILISFLNVFIRLLVDELQLSRHPTEICFHIPFKCVMINIVAQ